MNMIVKRLISLASRQKIRTKIEPKARYRNFWLPGKGQANKAKKIGGLGSWQFHLRL